MSQLFQLIKQAVPLLPEVEKTVKMKRESSSYKGCCPFHNERSASFSIKQNAEYYNCFGCGASGDVITFVAKTQGLTNLTAAKKLALEYGIDIPQEAAPSTNSPTSIYTSLKLLAEHWHKQFMNNATGAAAKRYLKERGFTPNQLPIVKKWQFGYCDAKNLSQLAGQLGVEEASLHNIGITNDENKLLFVDRLIFPICDKVGNVIAFGGRTIAESTKPKYLNSIETLAYKKGEVLYGLNHALATIKKNNQLVLVEGYLDVQACHFAGKTDVVGLCGTALSAKQINLFPSTTKWVILLDGDIPGQTAARKTITALLKEGVTTITILDLDEEDPYSLLSKNDWIWGEGFSRHIKAMDFIKFLFAHPHEDKDVAEEIIETIAECSNTFAREKILMQLSEYTKYSQNALISRLNEAISVFQRKKMNFL